MKTPVLVVDDDPMIRRSTARLLRGAGFDVYEAESPEPARSLYASVDVVLSDWDMPHGGGARVLEEAGTHVVVMTGNEDAIVALRARGVPVLEKPASAESMIDALRKAVAIR